MNGLDVAVVVIAGIGLVWGLSRGVLRMATSIVSLAGALYFASVYYPAARDLAFRYLGVNATIAAVIGYGLVFLVVFGVIETSGAVLVRVARTAHLGWIDRLAGAAAGGAISIAIAGLALMLLTAVLPTDAQLLKQSQLAPHVLDYTDVILRYIPPELKTTYERKRRDLTRYWFREAWRDTSPSSTSTPQRSADK
jgi:membrane protein required for colicin V production